jgi:hypothetical protein
VVKALCYKPEGRGFLPDALGPGVHSAFNRNEYQKQKIIMFLGNKVWPVCRAVRLAAICQPIV